MGKPSKGCQILLSDNVSAEKRGFAHWQTSFWQVDSGDLIEVDGILVAIFDDTGLCIDYREWSHCREMNHVD
jgi:hypothetical protein